MLASAADIPEELFDQILEFLTLAVVYKPEDRAPAKHHMNQCSLVCKFWASRCRPRIFDHITLRSLKDAQTLLSFSPAVKRYVIDLFLEETEPCEPWTHLIYRAVAHGDFSTYRFDFTHKLDGACTPMSVQTLRSLHPSLPQRTPVVIREAFHLYVMNYRLHAFTDIAHLVRKLWEPVSWHLDFTNISWIKPLDFVPPILGKKNRATCYQTEVRQCVDRWPFVWLSITTKQPEPNSLTPTAYLSQDEAFRLGAFVRCLTSSEKALKGRAYCSHTNIYLHGPTRSNGHSTFKLTIQCSELSNCMPTTYIICRDGHISQIKLEFNTDPAMGCMPFDFDWTEFDTLASHCQGLSNITMRLDADLAYVAEFAEGMAARLKHVHGAGNLVIFYESMGDEDQALMLRAWKFETPAEGDHGSNDSESTAPTES